MSRNPWHNGLLLMALNTILSGLCIVSFLGILALLVLVSSWRIAATGNPRSSVPFPVPILFLLYAVMFIFAWVFFARRVAGTGRQVFHTALIGALPLFGLCLLGYASVVWILVFGDSSANQMLNASIWVYSLISTLILLAGFSCVAIVPLIAKRDRSPSIS